MHQLPRLDHFVVYLCDTAVSPLDLYRTLATELGVRPSHRRAQLWTDIKKALVHMVDERNTSPLLVLDEAQHLSDAFLLDVSLIPSLGRRVCFLLFLAGLSLYLLTVESEEVRHMAISEDVGRRVIAWTVECLRGDERCFLLARYSSCERISSV